MDEPRCWYDGAPLDWFPECQRVATGEYSFTDTFGRELVKPLCMACAAVLRDYARQKMFKAARKVRDLISLATP